MCRQWRFQHSGSTRAFDYALYCRTRACMLCMFVLPPTSLIKVVNSGSFHWALSVFIYFRFMLAFRVQFAGDVNKKISFATTALANTFGDHSWWPYSLGMWLWIWYLWTTMLSVNRKNLCRSEKNLNTFFVFEASKYNILQSFSDVFVCHNFNVESSKRFTG